MPETLTVEMASPPPARPPFYRKWQGKLVILFVVLVIAAGILSWWLAQGKVSSVAAQLDTVVYTVGPENSARVSQIYVQPGQPVSAGQPLGLVQTAPAPMPENRTHTVGSGLNETISERLKAVQVAEKNMAEKVAQARAREEELRNIWQISVAEHVRAQLRRRALNPANRLTYDEASRVEDMARERMDAAKDEFEQYSRMRAAMDTELNKIRAELARMRRAIAPQRQMAAVASAAPEPVNVELVSPAPGKVLRVDAAPGQMLAAGQQMFLIIPENNGAQENLWVQAWFPLSAKDKINPGQKVGIKFQGRNDYISGKVASVSSEPQVVPSQGAGQSASTNINNGADYPRYLAVRINLDDPANAVNLSPGSKAECQIQTRYILGSWF